MGAPFCYWHNRTTSIQQMKHVSPIVFTNTFSTFKIQIASKLWTTDKKCTLYDCKVYKNCLQEWTEKKITGKKLSYFNPGAT